MGDDFVLLDWTCLARDKFSCHVYLSRSTCQGVTQRTQSLFRNCLFFTGRNVQSSWSGRIFLPFFSSRTPIIFNLKLWINFFLYKRKRPDKMSGHPRIWPDKTPIWPDIVRWPAVISSPVVVIKMCYLVDVLYIPLVHNSQVQSW